MIHIFNKVELTLTPSMQELSRVRDILKGNHIQYKIKVKTTLGSSVVRNGRTGNIPGPNLSETLYAVYVRRADLAYAMHLIL